MSARVVVGVTGGVAAYKTAMLVSLLAQRELETQVVMTSTAREFIGPATFAALSGKAVAERIVDPRFPLGAHIELARWGDVLCVAPATANYLAKAAHAMADDLLSTLSLGFSGPKIVAPAMNSEMWAQAAVQRNVRQLETDGVRIVGPGSGWLSCRQLGAGRMAEPAELLEAILEALPPARH